MIAVAANHRLHIVRTVGGEKSVVVVIVLFAKPLVECFVNHHQTYGVAGIKEMF